MLYRCDYYGDIHETANKPEYVPIGWFPTKQEAIAFMRTQIIEEMEYLESKLGRYKSCLEDFNEKVVTNAMDD